ncbi:MAG: IS1182 family transposase [Dehalococcoidia bacterium]
MPFRPFSREQAWLLPPTLDELIATDHPARFVAAFVDGLDGEMWEELDIDLEGDPMGAGAYHPRALLSIWVYGFMTGVRSNRKLEAACREQVPYMWLAGMQKPDHNTLWRFYLAHRDRMRVLLRRTVRTAVQAGLVDLALQAVDGTRIAANASKDRTFDAKGLGRLLDRVEAAIEDLEAQNATGGASPPAHLPEELASAEALRQRVTEALARVKQEEGPNYHNLTDKDAGLLNSRGGFIAGYNAQSMVAPLLSDARVGGSGMIITAVDVTPSSDDHPQLIPMIEASADNTGKSRGTVTLADAGYHSGANLAACASSRHPVLMPETHDRKRLSPYHKDHFTYVPETDTYLCPQGSILSFHGTFTHKKGHQVRRYRAQGELCRACPAFGECTKSSRGRSIKVSAYEPLLQRHRAVMATDWAKNLYRRRKALSEPVFGLLKEGQGARRFLLRGRTNVLAEWSLIATAFNLKSLHRRWRLELPPAQSPVRAAGRRPPCKARKSRRVSQGLNPMIVIPRPNPPGPVRCRPRRY